MCIIPIIMLLGINHNFKYKNMMFHVQTEDTGTISYHIETNLYLNGVIVAAKKTYYGDAKSCPELNELVRELMETQTKRMLLELNRGTFDDKIKALVNG